MAKNDDDDDPNVLTILAILIAAISIGSSISIILLGKNKK